MNQLKLLQDVSCLLWTHIWKCYKVRIYHRQAWNERKDGASFPLIWKETNPSASVDDVSGVALRHITLLCRDVISECNKCTTGCPGNKPSCDACELDYKEYVKNRVVTTPLYYGSFAEGCMLPTYFIWNEMNEEIKKCGDIDKMYDSEGLVGFSAGIESNIFAIIKTENCEPGFLRLEIVGNGNILRLLEITPLHENTLHVLNQQRHFEQKNY